MVERKRKILLLVEGVKTDVVLMQHLLRIYQFEDSYEIIPYGTNIYTLYHEMFEENDPEEMDLLQLLKEREQDPNKKPLFDVTYSDILLVFDLDPQAPDFSAEKVSRMAGYFTESSDMGKLYLNYPMVEAFYHMAAIPDPDYLARCVSADELRQGNYKARVNRENRNHDYRKFAVTRAECTMVIRQNIEKAQRLLNISEATLYPPGQEEILHEELRLWRDKHLVSVLSTCPFFIADYNPALLEIGP